jgi:hypothetical protein
MERRRHALAYLYLQDWPGRLGSQAAQSRRGRRIAANTSPSCRSCCSHADPNCKRFDFSEIKIENQSVVQFAARIAAKYRGDRSSHHEMQRPKICARAGSAERLNAGSYPIGGRRIVVMNGDEVVDVLGAGAKRSPLLVRFVG